MKRYEPLQTKADAKPRAKKAKKEKKSSRREKAAKLKNPPVLPPLDPDPLLEVGLRFAAALPRVPQPDDFLGPRPMAVGLTKNYKVEDNSAEGKASIVRFRRPTSAAVVKLFDEMFAMTCEREISGCFLDRITTAPVAAELVEMYNAHGIAMPKSLAERTRELLAAHPAYTRKAERLLFTGALETDFSDPTTVMGRSLFPMGDTTMYTNANQLSHEVFGCGLGALAGPALHLMAHHTKDAGAIRKDLGLDTYAASAAVAPRGAPPETTPRPNAASLEAQELSPTVPAPDAAALAARVISPPAIRGMLDGSLPKIEVPLLAEVGTKAALAWVDYEYVAQRFGDAEQCFPIFTVVGGVLHDLDESAHADDSE